MSAELELRAGLDEAEQLVTHLRTRCVALNHEIRLRDERIAALEAAAATADEGET